MIKLLSSLVFFFAIQFANGQPNINLALKKELDSIFREDQQYRELLFSDLIQTNPDSIAKVYGVTTNELQKYLMNKMVVADSLNLQRIEQIIKKYGYPGKSLVGEPANETAFFVIQHSQHIDRYLPSIKKAAGKKELKFSLYAMMLDRSLMYQGKEQIYGTQGKGLQVLNPATGQKEFQMLIWPINNPDEVNTRRKQAGFKETVEENAKRMGISYKAFTIEEVNKMKAD